MIYIIVAWGILATLYGLGITRLYSITNKKNYQLVANLCDALDGKVTDSSIRLAFKNQSQVHKWKKLNITRIEFDDDSWDDLSSHQCQHCGIIKRFWMVGTGHYSGMAGYFTEVGVKLKDPIGLNCVYSSKPKLLSD